MPECKFSPPVFSCIRSESQILSLYGNTSQGKPVFSHILRSDVGKKFQIKFLFLGELISYTFEKLSDTCKDDNCLNQCSDVLYMVLCEHLYSYDCGDPANLCKHIHKLYSNLVSKKIHVNTDPEIINEIDMTDGFECFAPLNYIKNPENQEKNLKKTFRNLSH